MLALLLLLPQKGIVMVVAMEEGTMSEAVDDGDGNCDCDCDDNVDIAKQEAVVA